MSTSNDLANDAKEYAIVCATMRADVDALLPADRDNYSSRRFMDGETYDTIALASLRLSQASVLLQAVAGDSAARDVARIHISQYRSGRPT